MSIAHKREVKNFIVAVMKFKCKKKKLISWFKKKKVVQIPARRNWVLEILETHQDHWAQQRGYVARCLGAKDFGLYCNQLRPLRIEGLQLGHSFSSDTCWAFRGDMMWSFFSPSEEPLRNKTLTCWRVLRRFPCETALGNVGKPTSTFLFSHC